MCSVTVPYYHQSANNIPLPQSFKPFQHMNTPLSKLNSFVRICLFSLYIVSLLTLCSICHRYIRLPGICLCLLNLFYLVLLFSSYPHFIANRKFSSSQTRKYSLCIYTPTSLSIHLSLGFFPRSSPLSQCYCEHKCACILQISVCFLEIDTQA